MESNKRTKRLHVRVNNEELAIIKKRVERCHVSSVSDLCRQMILHGIYLEYDQKELQKTQQAVSSVANHINQIAHRVNSTGRVYEQDLCEIKEEVHKIWNELDSILTELKKLNFSNS